MKCRTGKRLCFWILFYAVTLLASLVLMGVVSAAVHLATWKLAAVGLWLLVCFASLCFPEDIWDRWIPGEKEK